MWTLLVAAACAVAPDVSAQARARVGTVHAPPGTDAETRAALSRSLERHLAHAKLDDSLKPYQLSPSLVQLRRYVESPSKQVKLVCVVDLALMDAQGVLVASVRGNVTTPSSERREAIDAAAHAVVSRLPAALQALGASDKKREQVAQR